MWGKGGWFAIGYQWGYYLLFVALMEELACGTGQLSYPLSSRVRLWEAKIRIMDTAAVFMSMGLIMVRQVLMGGGVLSCLWVFHILYFVCGVKTFQTGDYKIFIFRGCI